MLHTRHGSHNVNRKAAGPRDKQNTKAFPPSGVHEALTRWPCRNSPGRKWMTTGTLGSLCSKTLASSSRASSPTTRRIFQTSASRRSSPTSTTRTSRRRPFPRWVHVAVRSRVAIAEGITQAEGPSSTFDHGHITIVYIYHALINALSAHMIYINLNMIFYTLAEHSPTKTI